MWRDEREAEAERRARAARARRWRLAAVSPIARTTPPAFALAQVCVVAQSHLHVHVDEPISRYKTFLEFNFKFS